MYEAPDRYKRLISARLPGGESAGLAVARVRERKLAAARRPADLARPARAVLRRRQYRRRADDGRQPVGLGSPRPAAAVGRSPSPRVNFGAMQLARTQSITCVGRSGRRVPKWLMVGEVVVRAAVWLSAAALSVSDARSGHPGDRRLDHGRPRHRRARPGRRPALRHRLDGRLHRRASCGALLIGRHTRARSSTCCRSCSRIGVAIFGVLTVARWAFHQLKTNADVGSQSESASLLLQEYEQRGVGWLWAVDSENRVTYISSRMSALLGKPASAAARPFASRAARRPCRARPGAAREAAVQLRSKWS